MARDPDKQRFLDAVNHVESAEIALYEMDPDMAVVNRMVGRDYPMSLHIFDLPAEDQIEVSRVMGNDMMYFYYVWRVGRKERKDADGRIHYMDGTVKTEADLDNIWAMVETIHRTEGCVSGNAATDRPVP